MYILERAGICTFMYMCVSYVEVVDGGQAHQYGMLSCGHTIVMARKRFITRAQGSGKHGEVAYIMRSARLQSHW